ncbi:MAG: tripartite tricarboxylate transporter substrate binding protein, partial [Xanthobacteraceae bacterium]
SRTACAQTYPSRPVHIIVGFPAGFAPDIIQRLIAQSLSERLGQRFVVDNRPGAGSNIAAEEVVKAPPDGYELLQVSAANAINATLYENLNFDFVRDIAPVASIARTPLVMAVNPSVSAKTVPEFIAYAKANPGKINMASAGNGSPPHVAGELFKMMAGVDMLHVPYRGNYYPDLLGGQVQVAFANITSSIEYVRTGRLRALAVTTATRVEALPDIPAVAEFVPGYEASSWQGIGAPRNTPAEIIEKLNKEINAGLADANIKTRLADLGAVTAPMTPSEFAKFVADETEKWGKVIRAANIKLQ